MRGELRVRLIVDAVPGKKSFGDEAGNLPVHNEARAIEQSILMKHRQPKRDDHAARLQQDVLKRFPGTANGVARVEDIFAAVTRDA